MVEQDELLKGIRVIDLSQYIPGPFATRQFSDLGADIIKVEPLQGDPMLTLFQDRTGASPIYEHLNRGKRIVRLDLKTKEGLQSLKALITNCDVLLESFRPGVIDRLGLDQKQLKAINPGLIHCALSGFGQTGPYAQQAGHDLTYCAVGGALGLTGTSEKPVMSFPPIADHAGALQAANTILAALVNKLRTGSGCYIDISLFEPILSWQYLHLLQTTPSMREEMQLNGGLACYQIYQTVDNRFVALAALESKFWIAFCNAVKREPWIKRHYEATPQISLSKELAEMFGRQPQNYWTSLLETVDCCFEAIPKQDDIAAHPQIIARQSVAPNNEPLYPAWLNHCPPVSTKPAAIVTGEIEWVET